MSDTLIREIAEQIFREEILFNWHFYLLMLAVLLIGTTGATFITTYLRKRAETYATKADLQQLIQQLRATTTAAEQIKTTIAHVDWTTKEWKTLRRIKLEELVTTVYAVSHWLEKTRGVCLFNRAEDSDVSPIWKLELIARLYFPELASESAALKQVYYGYNIWMLGAQQKLTAAGPDMQKRQACFDEFMVEIVPHQTMLLAATTAIELRAPMIMKEIVGA
jgi:hypothetical protein